MSAACSEVPKPRKSRAAGCFSPSPNNSHHPFRIRTRNKAWHKDYCFTVRIFGFFPFHLKTQLSCKTCLGSKRLFLPDLHHLDALCYSFCLTKTGYADFETTISETQEIGDVPCDTGSDLGVLKKEMEDKPVDLSLVHDGWNNKKAKWAANPKAIEARAKEARQWLKARPEKEIVLVTHGGFLHFFTEDWAETNKFQGRMASCLQRVIMLINSCRNWLGQY